MGNGRIPHFCNIIIYINFVKTAPISSSLPEGEEAEASELTGSAFSGELKINTKMLENDYTLCKQLVNE